MILTAYANIFRSKVDEFKPEMKNEKSRLAKWLGRFGLAGFLFFLFKGLLWLVVPAMLIWLGVSC